MLEKNSSMNNSVFRSRYHDDYEVAVTVRDSSVTNTKIRALGSNNQMRLSVFRSTFQLNTVSVRRRSRPFIYFELPLVTDSAFVKEDEPSSTLNLAAVSSKFTNTSISLDRAYVAIISSYISINSPIRMVSGLIRCSVITTEIPYGINGITVGSSRDEYDTRSFNIINSTFAGFKDWHRPHSLVTFSNRVHCTNIENTGPNPIEAKRKLVRRCSGFCDSGEDSWYMGWHWSRQDLVRFLYKSSNHPNMSTTPCGLISIPSAHFLLLKRT